MKTKMGYCGNVCNYCPRYRATQSGDRSRLKEVAILWYKAGARPEIVTPEDMICHGCFPNKICQFGIAQCASDKGGRHCGECSDYPCDNLRSRFEPIPSISETWKSICTREEYELIHKAFWQKKENLDKAREEYLSGK